MTETPIPRPRWKRWGKEALWLLLMVLIVSSLLDLWRGPTLPAGAMEAPLTLQDGTITDLATLSQGRPLLVYYWASWCGVCRFTTPAVEQLWQEGGKRADGGAALRRRRPVAAGHEQEGARLPHP